VCKIAVLPQQSVEGILVKVLPGLPNLITQGIEVLKREFELDNATFDAKHWLLLLVEFKPVKAKIVYSVSLVVIAKLKLLQKPVV
jgi:hypothetical protein